MHRHPPRARLIFGPGLLGDDRRAQMRRTTEAAGEQQAHDRDAQIVFRQRALFARLARDQEQRGDADVDHVFAAEAEHVAHDHGQQARVRAVELGGRCSALVERELE